jgi:hypothetical protein
MSRTLDSCTDGKAINSSQVNSSLLGNMLQIIIVTINILFLGRIYYLNIVFQYVKFVGHYPKVKNGCHIYSSWIWGFHSGGYE